MCWCLAVDTSDALAHVALLETASGKILEAHCPQANSHNEYLQSKVAELLAEARISAGQIGRLICGSGPGSFTGLRIGLGFMKGLSFSLKAPLQMISSLKAYANEFVVSDSSKLVCSLFDARRGECFLGAYRGRQTVLEPCIAPLGSVFSILTELKVEGEVSPESIVFVAGQGVSLPGLQEGRLARAGHVGRSLCQLAKDSGDNRAYSAEELSQVSPHYLRAVSARTIAERGNAQGGKL